MAKTHTRIKFEQWHRFINNLISGIALTEGDLKKRSNGEFYLQTEEKQIPISVKENPGDDGYYLITIATKKSKGWRENPDHTGKAPEHRKAARKALARTANNRPMGRTSLKGVKFRIKFSENMARQLPEPKETFPTRKKAELWGIQKYGSGTFMEFGNGVMGGWTVVGKNDKHKFNPKGKRYAGVGFGEFSDKRKHRGKGWHESPGAGGKAPIHKKVAERAQAKHAQNTPMKKKETLFEKWVAHLKSVDRYGKGFEMFDSNTDNESVEKLGEILKGGQEALDAYTDSLREYNLESEYEMFASSFKEFLEDEGIEWDRGSDVIKDEDEFRFEFESHINYNIGKFFDYHVLLIEKKQYEVSYDGASSEIDESDTEGKEFKKKALKYITEKQFNTILINSYGGVGYFGVIIHASEIIEAIQKGEKTVSDSDLVVGIHDWMNGAGYFERATVKPNYEISLNNAELDSGEYGIGGVFGTSEWKWR